MSVKLKTKRWKDAASAALEKAKQWTDLGEVHGRHRELS